MDFHIDWVNVLAFFIGSGVGFHLLSKSKNKKQGVLLVLKSILVGVGIAVSGEIIEAVLRLIVKSDEGLVGVLALFIIMGFITLKFIKKKFFYARK